MHRSLRGKPFDPANVAISSPTRGGRGTWGFNQSNSEGTSSSLTAGVTDGASQSDTQGKSDSRTEGTSQTRTEGKSHTTGTGSSETVHRRPLLQPDEVGRIFARIDDTDHPYFPGLALVTITGADPLFVRRSHYFEDVQFIDCFSPHPDHAFLPPIANALTGIRSLIDKLEAVMNGRRLTVAKWLIEPGKQTISGQPGAVIERVPPDNRTVHIRLPYSGKVSQTGAAQQTLPSGDWPISDGPLFTVKNYGQQKSDVDAFSELREACRALEKLPKLKPATPTQTVLPTSILLDARGAFSELTIFHAIAACILILIALSIIILLIRG